MVELAKDDIVRTFAEAESFSRPPLLVTEPLEAFFDARNLGSGPIEAVPIGDGHSNMTFLIERGSWRAVLRRPPRPPLPPSAHDVVRESRVMTALQGLARVPEILEVVDDESVIGAPFVVMEMVKGHVIVDEVPAGISSPDDRRRIGEELIDSLVEIHAVDWRAAGLEGFGKPTGYLARQLRRFGGLWDHNKTREIEAITEIGEWLALNLPESPAATIVHGDFRLGNVIVAPESPARIAAVLDWELATIGDPLADLGYLCMLWSDREDPDSGMFEMSPATREPGFARRSDLITMYEERSGRPVDDILWYQVLALWKAAIFMEGNYRRAVSGSVDDPFLKGFGSRVLELAVHAKGMIG